MPDSKHIQEFFFRAMIGGWATAGSSRILIPTMPGFKGIECVDGDYRLLDMWCTHPDSIKSSGLTTIWYQNNPVWIMHYGGEYTQEAAAVVKRALKQAYENRQFYGGRGQSSLERGSAMSYVNLIQKNDFADFCGKETVLDDASGTVVGYHQYWGNLLI
jgi:hypothetical protein